MSQPLLSWLFAASLVLAVAAGGLREGRRRSALNEALHELRRPLQALVLAAPAAAGGSPGRELDLSLRMAAAALERLEREINGAGPPAPAGDSLAAMALLRDAAAKWAPRAVRAGGSLELRRPARATVLRGDPDELARALDNLIANAIEHGGRQISVAAEDRDGILRVVVADAGPRAQPPNRLSRRRRLMRRAGWTRRGHGLRIVRRVAAAHGGRFELHRSAAGAEAVLELPCDPGAAA